MWTACLANILSEGVTFACILVNHLHYAQWSAHANVYLLLVILENQACCLQLQVAYNFFPPSKLYEEGFATIPKLAEKLTIELVHHIQVNYNFVQ